MHRLSISDWFLNIISLLVVYLNFPMVWRGEVDKNVFMCWTEHYLGNVNPSLVFYVWLFFN